MQRGRAEGGKSCLCRNLYNIDISLQVMTHTDYLEKVRSLKEDYSEEIPQEILHSTSKSHRSQGDQTPKSKFRKAWFHCVGKILGSGIRDGYLPRDYIERFREFHERNKNTGFHVRNTTREDIDYANRILDDILEELS